MGQNLIYYFLVKFADPSIIPDIHTVMYYDLFEDADGAYQHADFSEHRQYLLDRMCAQPEGRVLTPRTRTGSRSTTRCRSTCRCTSAAAGSISHNLAARRLLRRSTSSCCSRAGWEWGYWLHDVTVAARQLRAAARRTSALIADAARARSRRRGRRGRRELAEDQHTALIDEQLAAYLAAATSRSMLGRALDIISQPDRDHVRRPRRERRRRAGSRRPCSSRSRAYADALDERQTQLDALALPDSRWAARAARRPRDRSAARAVHRSRRTERSSTTSPAPATRRPTTTRATELARPGAGASSRGATPISTTRTAAASSIADANQTYYQYGYLRNADTLCYWNRELLQVGAILGNTTMTPPNCLF